MGWPSKIVDKVSKDWLNRISYRALVPAAVQAIETETTAHRHVMATTRQRSSARNERHELRQDQILDAAEQMIAEVGLTACTMDQVAKAAGLSGPLLYVYFRDMQALVQSVAERALRQLEARFEQAAASETVGLRKVLAIGQAYIAFAREEPRRFAMLSLFEAQAPETGNDPQQWQALLDVSRRIHAHTAQALRAGIDDGSIRPDLLNLDVLSKTLWALLHGVLQLAQTKRAILEADGHSLDAFLLVSMDFALQALVRRG